MSGLYTGSMGMISNIIKLEVHSNNLSNTDTTGFKADAVTFRAFDETYRQMVYEEGKSRIGEYTDQVYVDQIQTNFEEGSITASNNEYDLALHDLSNAEGVSFFEVSNDKGTFLTRVGNFNVDADGTLSMLNGTRVLGDNGNPITINGQVKITVRNDGTIVNAETDEYINKIQLKTVKKEDLGLLEKTQAGLYRVMSMDDIRSNFGSVQNALEQFDQNMTIQSIFGTKERLQEIANTGEIAIAGDFEGQVLQNQVERSNVDMSVEMVGLMETQRAIQVNQKAMTIMDGIIDKEANEISR